MGSGVHGAEKNTAFRAHTAHLANVVAFCTCYLPRWQRGSIQAVAGRGRAVNSFKQSFDKIVNGQFLAKTVWKLCTTQVAADFFASGLKGNKEKTIIVE